jgi:hypothetical protein
LSPELKFILIFHAQRKLKLHIAGKFDRPGRQLIDKRISKVVQAPGFICGINPKSKIENPQPPAFIRGVNLKSKISNLKSIDWQVDSLLAARFETKNIPRFPPLL